MRDILLAGEKRLIASNLTFTRNVSNVKEITKISWDILNLLNRLSPKYALGEHRVCLGLIYYYLQKGEKRKLWNNTVTYYVKYDFKQPSLNMKKKVNSNFKIESAVQNVMERIETGAKYHKFVSTLNNSTTISILHLICTKITYIWPQKCLFYANWKVARFCRQNW